MERSLKELEVSLYKALDKWLDKVVENGNSGWEGLGFICSSNLVINMTEAAILVLKTEVDHHNYLEENGYINA